MAIFHKAHGVPYHTENSYRGIWKAARAVRRVAGKARRRYTEIDLDLQMTKDGVIVCTHWARPIQKDGFCDPKRKLGRLRTVSSMTWVEVKRLRTKDGFKIHPLTSMLQQCADHNIGARLEPKADHRFENPVVWQRVRAQAKASGCKVKGYSIRHLGGRNAGVRRVDAMNAAGIPSKPIH